VEWHPLVRRAQPHPGTRRTLFGVSCISADACTAVGYYVIARGGLFKTLIESWNGTHWSVVPSPNPGTRRNGNANFLDGVSCVSADACTAVGYYEDIEGDTLNLIESWNGTIWSVVPSPSRGAGGNSLDAVSCASAGTCMAVGTHSNRTLTVSGSASG
jgi:hypothetical protein